MWPDDAAWPLVLPEPESLPVIVSTDAPILPGADDGLDTAIAPEVSVPMPLPALAEQALPGPQQILVEAELPSVVPQYPALVLLKGQHADASVLDVYLSMETS